MSPTAAWGKIYACEQGGRISYTDRPEARCRAADLSGITVGRYSSSRLQTAEAVAEPPKKQTAKAVKLKPKPTAAQKAAAQTKASGVQGSRANLKNTAPPRVPVKMQTAADSRRRILETELGNERKALEAAQKALAQARAVQNGHVDKARLDSLQEAVLDRRQNIRALQRELGRM
ncbi:DUF4124 domain-containing protein [Neisseria animalis]